MTPPVIPARISGLIFISSRVCWSRKWYEALGWRSVRTDDVFVPYALDGLTFALASLDSQAEAVAAVVAEVGAFHGCLLSLVVDEEGAVDDVLAAVADAGGRLIHPSVAQPWGRSGLFVDPAGTAWEVSWIEGRRAVSPFPGAPLPDALATSLRAVTVVTEDPAGLAKFYSESLGWGDLSTTLAGRPALVTDGGWLAFAPVDDASGPGLRGAFVVPDQAEVEALRASLVARGASGNQGFVTDPLGVEWEILTVGG